MFISQNLHPGHIYTIVRPATLPSPPAADTSEVVSSSSSSVWAEPMKRNVAALPRDRHVPPGVTGGPSPALTGTPRPSSIRRGGASDPIPDVEVVKHSQSEGAESGSTAALVDRAGWPSGFQSASSLLQKWFMPPMHQQRQMQGRRD